MVNSLVRIIDGALRAYCLYPIAEYSQKRQISPKLRVLRHEAALPFGERRKAAFARLADVVEHAGATVPYYCDLFRQTGFSPAKLRRDERYLQDLPYLTKEILREQGRRLVSRPYLEKIAREQKTGSSTGPAAVIYYDQCGLDWTAAQNILMLAWAGKRRFDRESHLSTRFSWTHRPKYPEFEAKKCFVLNRFNIYTGGFDDASQESLLADLKAARARIVQGHPSSMFAFARYVKRHGMDARGLFEIFVSTGEMLGREQRAQIEQTLGCRVSNRYGACEFGVMAQELANGPDDSLLVHDSLVWPECADIGADGVGELVFTNLRNPVMPLIRYRMGDLGRLAECADGWRIAEMMGRVHDNVMIDGVQYPTHYIQDILDCCGPIDDFQILVAPDGQARELRIVAAPEAWEAIRARVAENLPGLPARRIDMDGLVFTGIRGKFSYILREAA